jgi:hypothetical protein
VESNQDGQFFTDSQGTIPLALFHSAGKQMTLTVELKCFAKIIDSQKISSKLLRVS